MRVVGRIELERRGRRTTREPSNEQLVEAVLELVAAGDVEEAPPEPLLWRVDRNRPASAAISRSILAVKADAATRLFDLNCSELRWAVVDSGIDATHPAFRKRDENGDLYPEPFEAGRVARRPATGHASLRRTTSRSCGSSLNPDSDLREVRLKREERARVNDFRRALKSGRAIDWLALEPLLRGPARAEGIQAAGGRTRYARRRDPDRGLARHR